jgi:quinol monooxygenase YgiN
MILNLEAKMVRMFVRHAVADFDAWKKVYDDFDRESLGVTGHAVYRSVDDPNGVTVWHDFEDASVAKGFAQSKQLHEVMERAGVVGEPTIWFTEQV